MSYLCPICAQPLHQQEKSFCCDKRHQFDQAKEGYVNLLPVQKKSSKNPGDNKEMMQARREFLDRGFYQTLSDRVNQIAQDVLCDLPSPQLLDLGCGEGYYTNRLASSLTAHDYQCDGLDISKSAIRYAAKRYKNIRFCVASAYDTPFADASQDLITRIYAPSQDSELKRLIKPGGHLLTVTPASDHLFELKQKIYQNPEKHSMNPELIEGFELVRQEQLTDVITLSDATDCRNLLEMTPFAWKMSDEQKTELCRTALKLTLDFNINLYKRIS